MKLYNFPDHLKGDTYEGTKFTINVNNAPLSLTGAFIKMSLKTNKSAVRSDFDLSTTNGRLLITNATAGTFQVVPQIIDIPATLYYYDIEITLPNGKVKTYIEGQWKIEQDVTTGR
jgi:hypothetical protein